jgi:putative flippase GtrA
MLNERLTRAPAFLRFALVGGAGFIVNTGFLYLALRALHLGEDVAWFFAFIPSVTFTWWGNRKITFHEHASSGLRDTLHEWTRFVVTNSVGAVVNYATYEASIHWAPWPLSNPYLALACGVLAGMMFNFTLSKRLVFRPK